jgi:hypothetical protein
MGNKKTPWPDLAKGLLGVRNEEGGNLKIYAGKEFLIPI